MVTKTTIFLLFCLIFISHVQTTNIRQSAIDSFPKQGWLENIKKITQGNKNNFFGFFLPNIAKNGSKQQIVSPQDGQDPQNNINIQQDDPKFTNKFVQNLTNNINNNLKNLPGFNFLDFSNSHNVQCHFPAFKFGFQCVCPFNSFYSQGKCVRKNDVNELSSLVKIGKINRSIDGRDNNEKNKEWGSVDSILRRFGEPRYEAGGSVMFSEINPREISNQIGDLEGQIPLNDEGFTAALTFWGQFLDHDLDLVRENSQQTFNIDIPKGDKFFKQQGQIQFFRSQFWKSKNEARQFKNSITSWIDASNVYGSTPQIAISLRQFKNGKLKSSSNGKLLPQQNGFFIAGDQRVNQNIMLTSYHTIFMREHNRLCDEIVRKNRKLSDEQVYQIARHYVIGLIQKITFEDFLPKFMGVKYNESIGSYKGYNPKMNPNIPIEFATAGFRVGHPLLVSEHPIVDENGKIIEKLVLEDLFFAPQKLKQLSIDSIFRGLSITLLKRKNNQLVSDVRNFLINAQNNQVFFDLFSLNVQRGRDQGIPLYNEARKAYGLKPLKSFEQLSKDQVLVSRIKSVYKNINELQLWVGIICEDSVKKGVMGQLGAAILGETFRSVREGDRFWYEKAYPQDVVKDIKETSLGEIIRRNMRKGNSIPDDIFRI